MAWKPGTGSLEATSHPCPLELKVAGKRELLEMWLLFSFRIHGLASPFHCLVCL